MNESLDHFLRSLIDKLTDYDTAELNHDTPIEALELVSLDFVTIKVEAKKVLGIDIDLNALAQSQPETYGDLIGYLQKNALRGK
ncbi:phosphopantetheine-binding protein [Kosakonia cowanii]